MRARRQCPVEARSCSSQTTRQPARDRRRADPTGSPPWEPAALDTARAGGLRVRLAHADGLPGGARPRRSKIGAAILYVSPAPPAASPQTAAGLDERLPRRGDPRPRRVGPQVIEGWHGMAYRPPLTRAPVHRGGPHRPASREPVGARRRRGHPCPCPPTQRNGLGEPLKLIDHAERAAVPIYPAAWAPRACRAPPSTPTAGSRVLFVPELLPPGGGARRSTPGSRQSATPALAPSAQDHRRRGWSRSARTSEGAARLRPPPPSPAGHQLGHGRARQELPERRSPLPTASRMPWRGRSEDPHPTARRGRPRPRSRQELVQPGQPGRARVVRQGAEPSTSARSSPTTRSGSRTASCRASCGGPPARRGCCASTSPRRTAAPASTTSATTPCSPRSSTPGRRRRRSASRVQNDIIVPVPARASGHRRAEAALAPRLRHGRDHRARSR